MKRTNRGRRPASPPPPPPAGGDDEYEGIPFNFDKANPFLDAEGKPMPGICAVCGCEWDNPCDEGCGWANVAQTICTACTDKLGLVVRARRVRPAPRKRGA